MQIDQSNPYAVGASSNQQVAAFAADEERLGFIRRTYAHMTGAILALIAIEAFLLMVVPAATMQSLVSRMLSGWGWAIVLGAFMGVSWLARGWASSSTSKGMQYAGLGVYVVAQAIVLLPMLYICIRVMGEPQLPLMAGLITATCFIGLTAFVFMTGVDLAGWGKFLALGGIAAMAVIMAGIFFGFSLGLWFSGLMVAMACGYILYDTSNIMHHYDTRQHVAASLGV